MTEQRFEAADRRPFASRETPPPWPLSGRGREALRTHARLAHAYLTGLPHPDSRAVGAALARGEAGRPHRAVILPGCSDGADTLVALAAGRPDPHLVEGTADAGGAVFVFPGQGGQWRGMGRAMLQASPAFAARMQECEKALAPYADWSLTDVVRGAASAPPLESPDVVQPALFAVMVSLAELWRACGVEPAAVVGHSLGDVAAACVAGALSLADATRVVALWSRAQAWVAGRGEMVSVLLPEDELRARLAPFGDRLVVAAVNGPAAAIAAGDARAAGELVERLRTQGVQARRIDVGLAAHSPHIDEVLPGLREDLAPLRPRPPAVPLYSSRTGGRWDGTPMDADHWCRSLRGTVRFADAVDTALRDGHGLFVEVGPHPVLTAAVEAVAEEAAAPAVVRETLRRDEGGAERFQRSLAELYVHGADVDWPAVYGACAGDEPSAVELPDEVWRAAASAEPDRPENGRAENGRAENGRADAGVTVRLRSLPAAERRAALSELTQAALAAVVGDGSAAVDPGRPFRDLGLDSVAAVRLRTRLRESTGLELSPTLAFDHPTPEAVAAHLDDLLTGQRRSTEVAEDPPTPAAADEPIAIVGMACRYPGGVESPEELWRLLADGVDAVGAFPDDRGWDVTGAFDPEGSRSAGRYYQREGGFLYGAGEFDAEFFGISPREALAMDPQQRLLLEVSWEALERSGIDPSSLRATPTGVYVGAMAMDYGVRGHEADGEIGGYVLTGTTGSVVSGRVAYSLGLEGPAVTVDTACSSSLVALHQACQALRQGECTTALAGGVTVMPSLSSFVEFSRQGGLAADGRCKAFADGADGFGLAEGVGVVVLERLSVARARGRRVLAVVRGSAVNQDGASNGLTAPSGPSQQRVVRRALAAAGVGVGDVDVVEAHGTGTRLGDPIEAQALLEVFGPGRDRDRPVWLGSLKSNIGHTQAAAGVGGVIKMVLALRHGVVPRTLHAGVASSAVDWSSGAVRLATQSVPWPVGDRPRRAGVSSFGISGTNAHIIIEDAPPQAAPALRQTEAPSALPILLPVSGRTTAAVAAQAERLHACLASKTSYRLADIGYSLATARAALPSRAVVLARDGDEALRDLAALAAGEPAAATVTGAAEPPGRTVFVFPGQGAQWQGMAVRLLDEEPVFARRMSECSRALAEFTDWSLPDVLRGDPAAPPVDRVDVVQPALFAVMVSLAALWRSYGVEPDAVVGHSQGEIAAACVAGALDLRDAARVVALRSRAIRDELAGRGGMLSLALPRDEVAELLARWEGRISLAAANGPVASVVSGEPEALRELHAECGERGIRARMLPVDYASHSAHVEAVRDRLAADLGDVAPRSAAVPFHSSTTGSRLDASGLDAGYWYRNLRGTVEFESAVRGLAERGHTVFVEVSPHPVLTASVQETCDALGAPAVALGTLKRDEGGADRFRFALAQAHAAGAAIDWERVFDGLGAGRVDLPSYAFRRTRYWQEPAPAAVVSEDAAEHGFWQAVTEGDPAVLAAELGVPADATLDAVLPALARWRRRSREHTVLDSWRYRISWKPLALGRARPAGRWLVFVPEPSGRVPDGSPDAWLAAVERALGARGAEPVRVTVPVGAADRETLTARLAVAAGDGPVSGIVSLLADTPPSGTPGPVPAGTAASLALVQALGDADVGAPLWMVTHRGVAVGAKDPAPDPSQAALWGLGRIVGLEHPERWGGLIDLPEYPEGRAEEHLAAVLADAGSEDQIALRDVGALGRRLGRAPLGAAARHPWRPSGTVLVTGGTGAIGGHVARWLADRGAAHIVLVSRRGPAANGATQLEAEVAARGVKVTVAACDIADRAEAAALVDEVERAAGPIGAVFHTAGVLRTTELDRVVPDEFAEVAAAKVDGARHLDALLGDRLDAFVLFSSNGGVWGSRGQGAYAAANAALDALAEQRRARGAAATSVAWGLWGGGGTMADARTEEQLRQNGLRPMDPEAGIASLQRALDAGDGFVSVADIDWERFAPAYCAARPRPLISDLPEVRRALEEPGADQEEPDGLVGRLAGLAPDEQETRLRDAVLQQAAAVLGHGSPAGMGRTRAFRDLGFDSLTAVELRNRLVAVLGVRLPATLVFDHPNPAALAAHLRRSLLPRHADADGDGGGGHETATPPTGPAATGVDDLDDEALVRLALGAADS